MEKQVYIAQAHFTDSNIGAVTRKDRLMLTEEHAANLGELVRRQQPKIVDPAAPVDTGAGGESDTGAGGESDTGAGGESDTGAGGESDTGDTDGAKTPSGQSGDTDGQASQEPKKTTPKPKK